MDQSDGPTRSERVPRTAGRRQRVKPRVVRTDNDKMWDSADVADYLKVSIDWVRRHFNLGHLPGHRLPSGQLRFEPGAVRAYARGAWTPAPPPAA